MSIVHSCERNLSSTVLSVGREDKNGKSRNDCFVDETEKNLKVDKSVASHGPIIILTNRFTRSEACLA